MRLISNRTPEDFATGKVMSSQFMFGDALQAERDLGLNDWEKQCPNTDALGVTIAGPDGGKAVEWVYTSTSRDKRSTSASNIPAG